MLIFFTGELQGCYLVTKEDRKELPFIDEQLLAEELYNDNPNWK